MALIFFVLLMLIAGGGGLFIYSFLTSESPDREEVVAVRRGETLRGVSKTLERQGIVKDAVLFELFARAKDGERGIRAGRYRFPPRQQPAGVLDRLLAGAVELDRLTLRENSLLDEVVHGIAERCEEDPQNLYDLIFSPEWKSRHGIEGETAQGYLFPDTYFYEPGSRSDDLIEAVMANFKRQVWPLWEQAAPNPLLPRLYDVLILASIVEAEGKWKEELPTIAAVFLNRLRIGIPLQSDPTVIYATPFFDGNLRKEDLLRDHAYNTYTRKGLPPGPIGNPGLLAIRAVLYPASVSYLYFVAGEDGHHVFSETLDAHNAAVRRYQKKP